MPTDIYIKLPGDKNYTEKRMQVELDIDRFAQSIEMLLMTTKGTVLGYPDMGCNLDSFLWNPYVTVGTIRTEITSQIQKYVPEYASTIPFDVQVEFIKGDLVDGIYVNVIIDAEEIFGLIIK
jgi:phage baseplate assembly protein W